MFCKCHEIGEADSLIIRFSKVLKLVCFGLFVLQTAAFAATSASQNQKVSVEMNDVKIEKVLDAIESQTNYVFMYNTRDVDVTRTVNVHAKDIPVSELLDDIFAGTDITYSIRSNHIVLSKKSVQDNSREIRLKVIDESGVPVAGANVIVKGGNIGDVTDSDGNLTLTIQGNPVLEVSFMGFITQEVLKGNFLQPNKV